ncbi:UNVERIFIED_ORG: hypothetical protein BDU10_9925 [Burkholderia sp. CF145]|uniref:RNA recognition motif domain-containing protein n=1 Tax=Paraburkholderia hospita TaxID=169430 RepID=UPI0002718225|nr:RNA-binding protein [Paraburkholderia hospita]EUC12632.1 hypothetical protein PMI06_008574 [Burkholderia sp. BT03]SKC49651.1 hypothetical protein SAMN06266956_0297 [Paraburkholderia hospita]SKD05693.1 hypothetical protein SAMN05445504_9570 [Burkholderia sp. CF099]
MAELWIGNVETDTPDDEIREFFCRYGFPSFDTIKRVEGTGERPAVVLGFDGVESHALRALQLRVHNMFWKGRTLVVQVVPPRNET